MFWPVSPVLHKSAAECCACCSGRSVSRPASDDNHAGVDEAGRGPLAGPVVAAAVVMPPHVDIPGIGDSKALTSDRREALYEALMAHPAVDCAT